MKKIFLFFVILNLLSPLCFSQNQFSDETKKYITYNDPITVFKNALLIDGYGGDAKPIQFSFD
jgi:hypothetical protein